MLRCLAAHALCRGLSKVQCIAGQVKQSQPAWTLLTAFQGHLRGKQQQSQGVHCRLPMQSQSQSLTQASLSSTALQGVPWPASGSLDLWWKRWPDPCQPLHYVQGLQWAMHIDCASSNQASFQSCMHSSHAAGSPMQSGSASLTHASLSTELGDVDEADLEAGETLQQLSSAVTRYEPGEGKSPAAWDLVRGIYRQTEPLAALCNVSVHGN